MHNRKILLFFSLCIYFLNCYVLSAQDTVYSRENSYSLLWKIEGNSLKKPSYLFGTMHVRNKKAFAFSDSVLVKLLNVDVFAAEFDIDTMYKDFIQKTLNAAENKLLFDDDFAKSEIEKYKNKKTRNGESIDFNKFKNKSFKELKDYFDNFESFETDSMPAFVDAYLYEIAKLNGKHVMGMEPVESGMSYLDTLSKENKKRYLESKFDSLPYFLDSKDRMLQLYHMGNVDSIWQFYTENWYYLKKILLDNRNVIMVDTMEKIMKNNSVFIAAGVAHLPGEQGLIQLFRNKGYTVTKVNASFSGITDSVMESFNHISNTWVTHTDSSKQYTIEVPVRPVSYDLFGGILKMFIAQDVLKDNYYYFYAVPKVLSGIQKDEDILEVVKAPMGANNNGKILSNKKIQFNGIQGYEMIIKKESVFEAKARIYIKNDFFYFQMVGNTKASYNTDDAKRFFESFKTLNEIEQKKVTWEKYSYNEGAFSVRFPDKPNYMKKEVPVSDQAFQNPYYFHMLTDINTEDKEVYIIRWNDLPDGRYYDNTADFYQVIFSSILGDSYKFDPEKEIKLDAGTFQGYESVQTVKESTYEFRIRAYLRGNRTYLLLGQTFPGTKDSKVDDFFNSFEGIQFSKTEFNTHNIDGLNIQLPAKPVIIKKSETLSRWDNKVPHKIYSSTDANNGVLITVTVNTYPKYYYTTCADSLLKNIEKEYFDQNQISDTVSGKNKQGVFFRSGTVTFEDSPNKVLYQYFLNGNKSYEIHTYISEELLKDSLQNQVFCSISFDTIDSDFNMFNKKTDLIFEDLLSQDSVTFKSAKEALNYHPFDSTDISALYKAVLYNYPDSSENWGSVKNEIIDILKENHDKRVVNVLKESFRKDYVSKISIITAISEIDSLQKNLVFNLLTELRDSSVTSYKLSNIYEYLADSSIFFKEKISDLIRINKTIKGNETLINVINNNFDTLKLEEEQLRILSEYCIDLFNESLDSLQICAEDDYNRYYFEETINSVLLFFVKNTSASFDTYFEKTQNIDNLGILAKTCLYNLNLNNKINSSQITKVIEDAEYGWEFLVEASELNVLSKINKKVLKEEDIALTYLKNTFYWDDEYVPEKFELIGIRKIQIKGNVYNCYIFSFSDGGDESYLAISGGFKISDGKLDQDDIFYDYSYEQADSKTKKEEIISNLISTYIEDTLPE